MSDRPRRIIALLCATFVLSLQVAPAFAICVCDTPRTDTCCAAPEPVPEKKDGCCATQAAELSHPSGAVLTSSTAPAKSCQKAIVSPEFDSATVPYETADYKTQFEGCTVGTPVSPLSADNGIFASAGHYRGPPELHAPAIFLRNASFLI